MGKKVYPHTVEKPGMSYEEWLDHIKAKEPDIVRVLTIEYYLDLYWDKLCEMITSGVDIIRDAVLRPFRWLLGIGRVG